MGDRLREQGWRQRDCQSLLFGPNQQSPVEYFRARTACRWRDMLLLEAKLVGTLLQSRRLNLCGRRSVSSVASSLSDPRTAATLRPGESQKPSPPTRPPGPQISASGLHSGGGSSVLEEIEGKEVANRNTVWKRLGRGESATDQSGQPSSL